MSKPKSNKPKKAKPVGNGKHPVAAEASEPMKAALDAVAAMPVGKVSKLGAIVALLQRPEGATIDDVMATVGWQSHSVRAFISHTLVKKHGYKIVSEKPLDGKRVYRISEAEKDDH